MKPFQAAAPPSQMAVHLSELWMVGSLLVVLGCIICLAPRHVWACACGPGLGTKVSFVSVSVDPDHDRPSRLLDYARAFNANVKGWYFLTGSPARIDQLLRNFGLGRSRDSSGEIDHILGYFLVGPDGHEIADYSQRVDPSIAAREAEEAAAGSTLIGRLSAELTQF